jgi:hypothetical protein
MQKQESVQAVYLWLGRELNNMINNIHFTIFYE